LTSKSSSAGILSRFCSESLRTLFGLVGTSTSSHYSFRIFYNPMTPSRLFRGLMRTLLFPLSSSSLCPPLSSKRVRIVDSSVEPRTLFRVVFSAPSFSDPSRSLHAISFVGLPVPCRVAFLESSPLRRWPFFLSNCQSATQPSLSLGLFCLPKRSTPTTRPPRSVGFYSAS